MSRASSTTRRAAISGDIVISKVSGEQVVVASGAYLASGINVVTAVTTNISGQPVFVHSGEVHVTSGQLIAKVSGESVVVTSGVVAASVSGNIVISKVSGESVIVTSGLMISKVSGEIVTAKVSGETVVQASGAWLASGIWVQNRGAVLVSGAVVVSGAVMVSGFVSIYSGSVSVSSGQIISKVSGEVVDIKVPTSITSGGIFQVTAASGGAILTSSPCVSVTIKSMSKNSGDIYIAGNPMQSGQGFVLEPGEAVNLDVDNMGRAWLLAMISGDRVTFVGVL